MLKWLFLFAISSAHAQSFLTSTNLSACLARSQQQCQLLGCDGVNTIYWWACQPLTNGQAALVVQTSGRFTATATSTQGSGGLNAAEQSSLKNTTQLATALPWVLSIITFRARFTTAQITAITSSTDTVVTSGWNAINGAATVNLKSPSVIATVNQIALDGLIPATGTTTILQPAATP